MVYFKCFACRTRLYSARTPADLVGDLCPGCGALLEPVGTLTEVAGLRTIRWCAADGDEPGTHQRIADRVDDFLSSRNAALAQASLDAERWIDDGGSFRADAAALAGPETNG